MVAANAAAQAAGVTPGVTLAGALAVAPALQLVEHDPLIEATLLDEVATWAGCFTPSVAIDPPDTLLLEVAASLQLFGGIERLQALIGEGIPQLGLAARQAGAPTPLAARWLARHCPGSCITDTAHLGPALERLPLAALADGSAVGGAVLELLGAIGCHTLGEVAALPRKALARRQGRSVSGALDRALGRQPDPRPCFVPPARHSARLPLLVATDRSDTLLFLLRRLLHGLCGWLGARHAGVDRLQLRLEHEDRHPPTLLDIVCGAPCRDEARLTLLIREHLERLQLVAPVEALQLVAAAPVPLAGLPNDFFDDSAAVRENGELLALRLRARLGETAVRRLQIAADHRPEHAFTTDATAAGATLPAAPRPLWLLPEPRPLRRGLRLTLLSGPERIESGWWDGHDVRRDYYVAQTPQGSLLWLFRSHADPGQWQLHGYFG